MRLEGIATEELEGLVERLSDIRHDLGKYITFEVRFLGPGPQQGDLREALRSDLYRTHQRGDVYLSAWEVWEKLRPLVLEGDPDVVAIDEALLLLRDVNLDQPQTVLMDVLEAGA